ncbi:MAG TPA: amidohydrolase family protein [Chitinophagaceae bacterium]|mgnify:CR=1 FL=1|nr:amidohydrolase family protein [Chitinophagaceae bacterium]
MRLLFSLLLFATATSLSSQVLIKNVNVLDVENRKVLSGYNVVVLDGKIVSVDKGKNYKLPEGTEVIDGTGKWLVPGYTDAHVHFFQSGGMYARPDVIDLRKHRSYDKQIKWTHEQMEDFCRRYAYSGITSVIDVGASYHFLQQRDTFTHKTWAPEIRMTGPLLTTYVPEPYKGLGNESPFEMMLTEEGVRESVRKQIPLHADFIKIWYIVLDNDIERGATKNLPLVKAAIDEAHKNNLRIAVHATQRITAQMAVEAGADFLVHSVDDEIISDAFVQLLKKKGTVLCPTLIVEKNYNKALGDHFYFTTHELNTVNPWTAATVIDYPLPDTALAARFIAIVKNSQELGREFRSDSIMRTNLKKLLDGGVIITSGTDAGNIGTQHAASYFAELKAMQDAGMNNWQILEASTINGAKAVGEEKEWGSIAKDKLANMLLLNANPLESLENWQKIDRVINKGIAYKPDSFLQNTPEMLAQQQLNAYNAHDLEAFLAPYADDVEVYTFPDKLMMKGKEEMRKNYQFVTKTPSLFCRLVNRIIEGNTVIDQEEVWGFGEKPIHGVAIYKIDNGKIRKVYFIQ